VVVDALPPANPPRERGDVGAARRRTATAKGPASRAHARGPRLRQRPVGPRAKRLRRAVVAQRRASARSGVVGVVPARCYRPPRHRPPRRRQRRRGCPLPVGDDARYDHHRAAHRRGFADMAIIPGRLHYISVNGRRIDRFTSIGGVDDVRLSVSVLRITFPKVKSLPYDPRRGPCFARPWPTAVCCARRYVHPNRPRFRPSPGSSRASS